MVAGAFNYYNLCCAIGVNLDSIMKNWDCQYVWFAPECQPRWHAVDFCDSQQPWEADRRSALSSLRKDGDGSVCAFMVQHGLETKNNGGTHGSTWLRNSLTKHEMIERIVHHEKHLRLHAGDPHVTWVRSECRLATKKCENQSPVPF